MLASAQLVSRGASDRNRLVKRVPLAAHGEQGFFVDSYIPSGLAMWDLEVG